MHFKKKTVYCEKDDDSDEMDPHPNTEEAREAGEMGRSRFMVSVFQSAVDDY